MKQKSGFLTKFTLLLSVLTVSLLMIPRTCVAAKTGSGQDEIKTLKPDTVYEYDLNDDGTKDEIQYKVAATETDGDDKVKLELYINDKLCMTRENHGFCYYVKLCDLNKSDKHMDLYIYSTEESDCINNSFFVWYNGKKLSDYIRFEPWRLTKYFNSPRFSLSSLEGNGKFYAVLDTPIYSQAIGCYYCYAPYQMKGNAITAVSTTTYKLTKGSIKYRYKAKKTFPVYSKAGSKTIVFNVKKGEKVSFDKLYVSKSGKAYFRLINSKGKTGWIKSDQENLFIECPGWG